MKNRYFTFEGYYFQTPGNELENATNVREALKQIALLFEQGYSDWEEAIQFLNGRFGRSMQAVTKDFKRAVERGDGAMARYHANRIIKRAQGKNI